MRRLIAVAALLAAGCGGATSARGAGQSCFENADCVSGLTCRTFTAGVPGTCNTSAHACSKSCSVDADCSDLGTGFKCFATCNGDPSFCGQAG